MTIRKLLLRIYLWCFATAVLLGLFKYLINSDRIFHTMAAVRKAEIVSTATTYIWLFLIFGVIYFFMKAIGKRLKRALSNLHFFITLVTFILFVIVYAKLNAFNELTKQTIVRDAAYSDFIEVDSIIRIIYFMLFTAQFILVVNLFKAFFRKKKEGKPIPSIHK